MAKAGRSNAEHNPDAEPAAAADDPETSVPDVIVEHEEIARLAYSYWEERGGQGGLPEDDWFRAEQEMKARPPRSEG